LSQWWTPPLRLQVSACSTFLMMCDVPSMAVFVGNLLLLLLSSSSSFLVTGFLSSLVILLLSQWWTPPLRLQVSACSTFLMMCDVPYYYYYYYYSICRFHWPRGLSCTPWWLGRWNRGCESRKRSGCFSSSIHHYYNSIVTLYGLVTEKAS
jgi:hypothetical protein